MYTLKQKRIHKIQETNKQYFLKNNIVLFVLPKTVYIILSKIIVILNKV